MEAQNKFKVGDKVLIKNFYGDLCETIVQEFTNVTPKQLFVTIPGFKGISTNQKEWRLINTNKNGSAK